MSPDDSADGVLVVGLWHDPGSGGFRARVTTGRGDDPAATTAMAATPEQVLELVSAWLTEMSRDPSRS